MTNNLDAEEQLRLSCLEATERLIDALSIRGFEAPNDVRATWRGLIRVTEVGAQTVVDVQIPHDFPYVQPKVTPLPRSDAELWLGAEVPEYYELSNSWHRERGGHLCLFEADDHTRLPWADPDALLGQVQAWLEQDRTGWPGDLPALDPERYLEQTGEVVLYNEIHKVANFVVRLRRRASGPWTLGLPAKVPRGRRGKQAVWAPGNGLVLDVGELTHPIRDWASLLDAADEHRARLTREVEYGIRELALIYRRDKIPGVLAVRLVPNNTAWTLMAHRASSTDHEALTTRSHPERSILAQRRVVIVGVGAVGSALSDLLHRSSIGELHLVDPDIVLPGNIVRHLVGDEHVGQPKVVAVKQALQGARPASLTSVTTDHTWVSSLEQASELLASYDLVIDASADSTASPLIAAAARAGAGTAVGVAVLADGYAIRVDHWPEPPTGGLPTSALPPARNGAYENGCSSPISTTPPAAVWEAAALGARHAIDVLLGANRVAGEERVLHSRGSTS